MALEKITEGQLFENGVISAPDTLVGSPEENKRVFDRMVTQLVAPAYNACVDAVNELTEKEASATDSEEARKAAEEERDKAEAQRQKNEENRKTDEAGRGDAEGDRDAAEGERRKNEASREAAEEQREIAERDRREAEDDRASAEDERADAESNREYAETARSVWEAYNSAKRYVKGNKVEYQGSSYINKKACSGIAPPHGEYWTLIAAKGDTGARGPAGETGATFIPYVDENGTLYWTNNGDGELDNPEPVNLMGKPGKGDMEKKVYDPDGVISEVGGIAPYVNERLSNFEGGTIKGGEIDGDLAVYGDVSVEGEVTALTVTAETVTGLNDAAGTADAVPLGQMRKELEKKLDKTGGVIADDDHETTLAPDGVVVSDGIFYTKVRDNGIRIEEDSEKPKSASFKLGELAFSSEHEDEDGDTFFETARMTPGGIEIETKEGKITLSIRGGLCFEDTKGNVNRLGGVDYIAQTNPDNAVMYGDMEQYVEEVVDGVKIETDNHTLVYSKDGKLSVNTADEVGDNTLPITAAAVNTTVGNIEVLLKTI